MTFIPKQLVIIGDSGVHGWGDREGGGWAERLKLDWMNLPNAPIIYSLGIRGDGLEKVAKRWNSEWQVRGETRRHMPDAVLLSIGLNDSARIGREDGRPQLTSSAYRFGLEQLLNDMCPLTEVMMLGLTPVEESAMPFAKCLWYSNEACSIYEAQIEEACLEANIPFLPIHSSMLNEPDFQNWVEPDGIHLNSHGHSWIHKKLMNWPSLLKWANLERTKQISF